MEPITKIVLGITTLVLLAIFVGLTIGWKIILFVLCCLVLGFGLMLIMTGIEDL